MSGQGRILFFSKVEKKPSRLKPMRKKSSSKSRLKKAIKRDSKAERRKRLLVNKLMKESEWIRL